jgi:hypothetical protein
MKDGNHVQNATLNKSNKTLICNTVLISLPKNEKLELVLATRQQCV